MKIPNRPGTYRVGSAILIVDEREIEILKVASDDYVQQRDQRRRGNSQSKWDNANRMINNISKTLMGGD